MPAAAVIKHRDLTVAWVNEGYMAMTIESPEELIGKRVEQIWAARDSAVLIEQHDQEVLDQRRATVQIEEVKDKWGKALERLRIRFPIYNEKGEIQYLGAIGFDYHQIVSRITIEPQA